MKPRSLWSELRIAAIAIAGISLLGVAGFASIDGEHDGGVYETRPKLPAAATARHVLTTTPRHIEWVAAPFGPKRILAFVVSPERSDRAPVVIVTAHNEGASDWARAVADRVAEAGFIAVVPDELTGEGQVVEIPIRSALPERSNPRWPGWAHKRFRGAYNRSSALPRRRPPAAALPPSSISALARASSPPPYMRAPLPRQANSH